MSGEVISPADDENITSTVVYFAGGRLLVLRPSSIAEDEFELCGFSFAAIGEALWESRSREDISWELLEEDVGEHFSSFALRGHAEEERLYAEVGLELEFLLVVDSQQGRTWSLLRRFARTSPYCWRGCPDSAHVTNPVIASEIAELELARNGEDAEWDGGDGIDNVEYVRDIAMETSGALAVAPWRVHRDYGLDTIFSSDDGSSDAVSDYGPAPGHYSLRAPSSVSRNNEPLQGNIARLTATWAPEVTWDLELTIGLHLVWRTLLDVTDGDPIENHEEFVEGYIVNRHGVQRAPSDFFVEYSTEEECHRRATVYRSPTVIRPYGDDIAIVQGFEGTQWLFRGDALEPRPLHAYCAEGFHASGSICGRALNCGTTPWEPAVNPSNNSACWSAIEELRQALPNSPHDRAIRRRRTASQYAAASPLRGDPPPQCVAPPRAMRWQARELIRSDFSARSDEEFTALWSRVNFSCSTERGEFALRLISEDDEVIALYWLSEDQRRELANAESGRHVELKYTDLDQDGSRDWLAVVRTYSGTSACAEDDESASTFIIGRDGLTEREEEFLVPVLIGGDPRLLNQDNGSVWRYEGVTLTPVASPIRMPPEECLAPAALARITNRSDFLGFLRVCGIEQDRATRWADALHED